MKKWLKKSLAVGLVCAMTAGLAACGGSDDSSGGGGGGNSGGGNSSANSQLAKENVYKVEEFDFPQLVDQQNGYVNIYNTVYQNDRIYMVAECYDWSTGDDDSQYNIISMDPDGSDLQVVELDTSDGEEDNGDGEGSASEPTEGSPLDGAEADQEENFDIWEYTNYGTFRIASDGKIFGIKNYSYEDYSNQEDPISERHVYLCCWNEDGSRIWESELEGLQSYEEGAEWIYVNDLIAGKDGSARLLLGGDNMYKMDISSEGEASERLQLSEETNSIFANSQNLIRRADGTFLVIYSDENDWTKNYITTYDFETDTLGEPAEMPASLWYSGYGSLSAGAASDLVFIMSNGIYSLNCGDTEVTKKMDFVNSDVNIANFLGLVELDENRFVGVFSENYGDEIKGAVFTYRDPADIPDKAVVVLAGNWINSDMRQRVVEFNRASDNYRIVLKEYESYNTYDDYNAGITKLNNDIVTGGMPDILITDGLPVENYIAKGLIADVGKLIAEDPELSQVEFMQNVFDAYSVDGTLYYVIPNFNVVTMIAKTSLVGDGTDWTLEKMQQIVASMGEGAQAIGETTRDGFMSLAMQFCGPDFVDVKSGKCSFNTEDFISMMEYAKTLPEEIDWDSLYGEGDYWMTHETQYRDNRTLLMMMYISRISNLNYQLNGNFGEPVTFIGFPTEEGQGSYVNAIQSFALSAKSANLDGAWEFIRYYLTDEYQSTMDWGIPVNKQMFLEEAQEATKKPTYIDEDGNEVEYEETYWINDEEIPLPPLSQEQVDQIVDFVMSVNQGYYYNDNVLNIINEEMGAFYSGQKSAQDTANVIQSRVQIYVDENR
ncbi:MAG: extracellular solute-binding protein [Lachnospiraceae bacterium]|nr:extracellular solute-binding protein [Butyrivibrio sp.]MCM1344304.1 extracellular solute-binding protein [Muribaculaceae bacterium]MCM1410064.1 extracellular solute-binding protein [Lachnospiraceae bacterium]